MLLKTKHILYLLVVLVMIALAFPACDKNETPHVDPGYVNIFIRPNSTEYIQLNSVGGWVYLYANPPSRGIIVYRMTQDEFKAFERTPTYKPDSCTIFEPVEKFAKIVVDESGIMANDTCSGSQYILLDGSVVQGPATYPLFAFKTNYDGETLHIYN